jgi:hypothetical protein
LGGPDRNYIPGGRRLAVSYVGLSYLMSDRIRYRTRLDGLDAGWVERGPQRSVEFVGLPPGDYTLHVAAAHPGGSWGQQEAVWSFSVEPFWWQRRSVQALGGLLLLAGLVALYRLLLQQLKASNLRLARRVDEATFDLQAKTVHLQALNQEKTELAERLARQAEAFERQAREDALTGLANRRLRRNAGARLRPFAAQRPSAVPGGAGHRPLQGRQRPPQPQHRRCGAGAGGAADRRRLPRFRTCRRVPAAKSSRCCSTTPAWKKPRSCARACAACSMTTPTGPAWGLRVTFSAGLVELDADDRTPALLYQRADRALYRAKSDGRDRTSIG